MISILSREGRISITDLAERVGLSKSPCQVRLKRLIDDGFILGFSAVLDHRRMGTDHLAFVQVKLKYTTEAALMAFNEAVKQIPEIEQCHMIAGPFDYLLKVRTQNIGDYRKVLGERISSLPNVAQSSTFFSMESVIDNAL